MVLGLKQLCVYCKCVHYRCFFFTSETNVETATFGTIVETATFGTVVETATFGTLAVTAAFGTVVNSNSENFSLEQETFVRGVCRSLFSFHAGDMSLRCA